MINLLKNDLKNAAKGDWKIVFGHYPCHSGGHYSGSTVLQEKVLPIMKTHNVDFYLTGHDHNQQHWVTKGDPRGIEHITTGEGEKVNTVNMVTMSEKMKRKEWNWNSLTNSTDFLTL